MFRAYLGDLGLEVWGLLGRAECGSNHRGPSYLGILV